MRSDYVIEKKEDSCFVEKAHYVIDGKFEIVFFSSNKGGILSIVDIRNGVDMPIGSIVEMENVTELRLENIANELIHLFCTTHLITFSRGVQQFEHNFQKVA